jgi:hypothetical protein
MSISVFTIASRLKLGTFDCIFLSENEMSTAIKNPLSFFRPTQVRRGDRVFLTLSNVRDERLNYSNCFTDADEIADRLQRGPLFHGVSLEDLGQVLVVSSDMLFVHNFGEILNSNKFKWRSSENVSAISDCDLAIVEIDSLGVLSYLVDELIEIRMHHPQCSIILVSAEFLDDDFGMTRHSICDISLRRSHSFARLEQAFVEALQNNLNWQEKCHSIFSCEMAHT